MKINIRLIVAVALILLAVSAFGLVGLNPNTANADGVDPNFKIGNAPLAIRNNCVVDITVKGAFGAQWEGARVYVNSDEFYYTSMANAPIRLVLPVQGTGFGWVIRVMIPRENSTLQVANQTFYCIAPSYVGLDYNVLYPLPPDVPPQ